MPARVGVTAEPECSAVDLGPSDRFLVLASDGVWGVLSSQAAVDVVARCATAGQGAQEVRCPARRRLLGAHVVGARAVGPTKVPVADAGPRRNRPQAAVNARR